MHVLWELEGNVGAKYGVTKYPQDIWYMRGNRNTKCMCCANWTAILVGTREFFFPCLFLVYAVLE